MTIEEISKGIADNPELETAIMGSLEAKLPDYLKGKGFQVATSAEFETMFGEKLKPKVSELYGNIEKDVLESFGIFGVKKDTATEKVYDLIKKGGKLAGEKLADVQKQLDDALAGKGEEVTKAQIVALTAQVAALEAEKVSLTEGFTAKELGFKVGQQLDGAYAELQITVPATVAEKDKVAYIKSRRDLLNAALSTKYKAKEENGNIVYVDADDKIQMNGSAVATAKDLLLKDYQYDFMPVKKAGSGSEGGGGGEPVVVQSKEQLYAAVAKEGLTMGSPEWITRVNELAGTNGIKI